MLLRFDCDLEVGPPAGDSLTGTLPPDGRGNHKRARGVCVVLSALLHHGRTDCHPQGTGLTYEGQWVCRHRDCPPLELEG